MDDKQFSELMASVREGGAILRMAQERDEARAKLSEVAAQCARAEEERDEARHQLAMALEDLEERRTERDTLRRQLAEANEAIRLLEGERAYLSPNAVIETKRRKEVEGQLVDAARCVRLLIERTRLDKRIHRGRLYGDTVEAGQALRERWAQWGKLPLWLRKEIEA